MNGHTATIRSTRARLARFVPTLLLPAVILYTLLASQDTFAADDRLGAMHGQVLHAVTREPIPLANLFLPGTTRGAACDLDGQFSLRQLEPGTYSLQVSALGYHSRTLFDIPVVPGRSREVIILLEPSVMEAEEVTVTSSRYQPTSPDLPTSARNLRYEEVRRAPGGLEDVQRTIQALPGVVTANDQDNAVIVRGGAPDENLMILDGIEVDNTNHLTIGDEVKGNGGPINALSTEFLRDVTFASGGFSARYGDRLSSVLVLDLREGNRERYAGAADLNMAGAGGFLEGPLHRGRGSFLFTAHRSYLSLLPPEDFGVSSWPDYWNSQLKITYDLTPKHSMTINALVLRDWIEDLEAEPEPGDDFAEGVILETGRVVVGARLRSLWSSGFSDIILARSEARSEWEYYDIVEKENVRDILLTASNRRGTVQDQLHFHWNGRAARSDSWAAGISIKPIGYEYRFFAKGDTLLYDDGVLGGGADALPDTFVYDDQIENVLENGLKFAGYLQYSWQTTPDLTFTLGVRHDGFSYSEQSVTAPRLSMSWAFLPRWTFSLAGGGYAQAHDPSVYMNQAGRTHNRLLPHAFASQAVAGLVFQPRTSSLFSVEFFHKEYRNLLVSEQDVVRTETGDRRFRSDRWLAEGKRVADGFELFAQQKMADRWYGTLSYSFGKAEARDAAFGSYPSDFDYRHVLTLMAGYSTSLITHDRYQRILTSPVGWWLWLLPMNGDEVLLSTRYRLMSGRPYTPQVWYGEGVASPEPLYQGHWEEGEHNSARYPAYSRWDVRADSRHYFKRSALVYFLEVQNVDDRSNVAEYLYKEQGNRETITQFRQFYVLGLRYEF